MSRFSFATTVYLTQGVPIETLSQMMGIYQSRLPKSMRKLPAPKSMRI
nr:hypothetical protein [Dysgonomonas sp. 511]